MAYRSTESEAVMWSDTPLTSRLGIRVPILGAPMAGGPSTPELAAAVSEAGGLGSLAVGYMSLDQTRAAIRQVKTLTDRPFAVNVLLTEPLTVDEAAIARSAALLAPIRAELGLTPPAPASYSEDLDAQLAVLLEEGIPAFSFTFGIPSADVLAAFKARGTVLMGTATTVREAVALEAAGVDVIVAQGGEAGGHRGTFLGPFESALVGTMALVPQVVDAVRVPVVAAGGIMDARGIVAALALGASGVAMGTAFLACPESGAHARHKEALRTSTEESTCVTRAFSGKPVRALENRLIRELRSHEGEWPAYPIQNALTRDIRRKASELGRTEFMGMWAGQGSRLSEGRSATELMAVWVSDVEQLLGRLCT
jgi:nitronate monooxygenase